MEAAGDFTDHAKEQVQANKFERITSPTKKVPEQQHSDAVVGSEFVQQERPLHPSAEATQDAVVHSHAVNGNLAQEINGLVLSKEDGEEDQREADVVGKIGSEKAVTEDAGITGEEESLATELETEHSVKSDVNVEADAVIITTTTTTTQEVDSDLPPLDAVPLQESTIVISVAAEEEESSGAAKAPTQANAEAGDLFAIPPVTEGDVVSPQDRILDAPSSTVVEDTSTSDTVSSPPQCPQLSDASKQEYDVKWVLLQQAKTPIIIQNANGPCPLLAIFNVLLLRGQIRLTDLTQKLTGQQLMDYLGDCLLRLTQQNQDISDVQRADYEQNLNDAMAILPCLSTGLNINVKFTSVADFEYTKECIVFDLLNIPLYHGWLVEPENKIISQAVDGLTYNQLVERIANDKTSSDESARSQAVFAEEFLDASATQLTYHGICELNARLKDGEVAVLFRNNHFSTIYKHSDQLYLLLTDQGFFNEKGYVWETLTVDGDGQFCDGDFKPKRPESPSLPAFDVTTMTKEEQLEQDFKLAQAIQDHQVAVSTELDRELASQIGAAEEEAADSQNVHPANVDSANASASPREKKQKDKCSIL